MRVINGTRELTVVQWANDWITADPLEPTKADEERSLVFSPQQVQLNADEVATLRVDQAQAAAQREAGETPHTGTFWLEWSMSDDGYFKRRMRYGRRPPERAHGSS